MWTYSNDPATSARDEVRFRTGDTDQTRPWTLQDEEINFMVTLYSDSPPTPGENFFAAANAADAIVAKLVRLNALSKSVGNLRLSVNPAILTMFKQTAQDLHNRATLHGVPAYFGGQSISEKRDLASDSDRVQPAAEIDGMSMWGLAGPPRSGEEPGA